ncbi:MAG: hypothetical protein LBQ05_02395 [Christensenellaceae bacterium]|nr:hypothetical protein [Christensenellaceae bacterium]
MTNDYFYFDDWAVKEFIFARPFRDYIEKTLKKEIVGQKLEFVKFMGHNLEYHFNDYKNGEKKRGRMCLDEPVALGIGKKQYEFWYHNTSHIQIGVNTIKVGLRNKIKDFRDIIGKKIIDIKLTTFNDKFYDSVAGKAMDYNGERGWGGDYFSDLVLIFENGECLLIYGNHEYMYILQNDVNDIFLFPLCNNVLFGDEYKKQNQTNFVSFVPCTGEIWHDEFALHINEDDFHFLYAAMRSVYSDFDIYGKDMMVTIEQMDDILKNFHDILCAKTFDDVLEQFCGVDYKKNTIKYPKRLDNILSAGYYWKDKDAEYSVYLDMLEWFNRIKDKCDCIKFRTI